MIAKYSAAQIVGLALVVLMAVIWLAWVIRRRAAFLRRLYVPTCVIGGFAMLALGPQVLGSFTGTQGLFPPEFIDVYRVLPGLLINVVFAAIMIGTSCSAPPWSATRCAPTASPSCVANRSARPAIPTSAPSTSARRRRSTRSRWG